MLFCHVSIVKVTLSSTAERGIVLSVSLKRQLAKREQYKEVNIEPDRERHQRIMEANMQAIARKCPGLVYKRCRVLDTTRINQQTNDDTHPV